MVASKVFGLTKSHALEQNLKTRVVANGIEARIDFQEHHREGAPLDGHFEVFDGLILLVERQQQLCDPQWRDMSTGGRILEIVENGEVVKSFHLKGDRRNFDAEGDLSVGKAGWLLLRAWNEGADQEVLDIYPYATTSPIYIEMPEGLPRDPADASYFVAWLDRVIADSAARTDYRDGRERGAILNYLRTARDHFDALVNERSK